MRKIINNCISQPNPTWTCRTKFGLSAICSCEYDDFEMKRKDQGIFSALNTFNGLVDSVTEKNTNEVTDLIDSNMVSSMNNIIYDDNSMKIFAQSCINDDDSVLQCTVKNMTHTSCFCDDKNGTIIQSDMLNTQVWSPRDLFQPFTEQSLYEEFVNNIDWTAIVTFIIIFLLLTFIIARKFFYTKEEILRMNGFILCGKCTKKNVIKNKNTPEKYFLNERNQIVDIEMILDRNIINKFNPLEKLHPTRAKKSIRKKKPQIIGMYMRRKNNLKFHRLGLIKLNEGASFFNKNLVNRSHNRNRHLFKARKTRKFSPQCDSGLLQTLRNQRIISKKNKFGLRNIVHCK